MSYQPCCQLSEVCSQSATKCAANRSEQWSQSVTIWAASIYVKAIESMQCLTNHAANCQRYAVNRPPNVQPEQWSQSVRAMELVLLICQSYGVDVLPTMLPICQSYGANHAANCQSYGANHAANLSELWSQSVTTSAVNM